MKSDDRGEVTRLIFHSTNRYYLSIGRDKIFSGDEMSPSDMFDVYEKMDAGQGIVAVDDVTSEVIGSCFVHPRETHISLGIMNVHPDHFGRGVARAILAEIIQRGEESSKPVRLVSSCFNLDSYSLYTRAGFVPFATFQDMYLEVPADGLPSPPPNDVVVRPADAADVEAIAAVELEVAGISRRQDYQYFIDNPDGFWSISVAESPLAERTPDATGGMQGYLTSCGSAGFNMIGPGVARDERTAAALFYDQINRQRGRTPVLLVPVVCDQLVKQLYEWGARNCEMHVAQSHGRAQTPNGIIMPTFLPETG